MSDTVDPVSYTAGLDDELLAFNLQLEEIEQHKKADKGKYKAGSVPDTEFAFSTFQAEVQEHINSLNDRILVHSIARAVEVDAGAIAELVQTETQEDQDRQLAVRSFRGNPDHETLSDQEHDHWSFLRRVRLHQSY
jgi:hypothetical protein